MYLSSWSNWPPNLPSLSACSFPAVLGLPWLRGRPAQFPPQSDLSGGDFLSLLRTERASVKMTTFGLGSR